MVETIRDSGQTLLSLINDVLDLTKIESGKFELDFQPFDLRHCIESAMDVVAVKALAQGLALAYIAPVSVPVMAVADVTRVRQILTNLLSNAVKFTARGEVVVSVTATALTSLSEGGVTPGSSSPVSIFDQARSSPTLRARPPSSPLLTTTSLADGNHNGGGSDGKGAAASVPTSSGPPSSTPPETATPYELHFAVRDTGIGIPLDRAHRLFQIFSQVRPWLSVPVCVVCAVIHLTHTFTRYCRWIRRPRENMAALVWV